MAVPPTQKLSLMYRVFLSVMGVMVGVSFIVILLGLVKHSPDMVNIASGFMGIGTVYYFIVDVRNMIKSIRITKNEDRTK